MNKKSFSQLLQKISIVLVIMAAIAKPIIAHIFPFGSASPLIFVLLAIVLLIFAAISGTIKIRPNNKMFILFLLLFFLPSLYNNPAIMTGRFLLSYLQYPAVIAYCFILSCMDNKEELVYCAMKTFQFFAIITSAVTILSIIQPSAYYGIIDILFDRSAVDDIRKLMVNHAYSGLTDHYSRNAAYVLFGIIASLYDVLKNGKKKYILFIFFGLMLLIIGKRAHLLFLIISIIVSIMVWRKMSIRTVVKITSSILIVGMLIIVAAISIPAANNTIQRFTDSGVSGDITTGRVGLYRKAFKYRAENDDVPIGWGGFTQKTNYKFAGVHNDYIQLYIEVGVVPLVVIIFGNIYFIYIASKKARNGNSIGKITLVVNIFYLIYSLTGLPHYDIELYTAYLLLNTFLFSIHDKVEGKNER